MTLTTARPNAVNSFWDGKRVLVTGGRGFLGTWVVEELQKKRPAKVITFSSQEYDLTEQADVRRLMKDTSPQVVIHLAGRVGGIGANRAHPGPFFYSNLIMGAMLMEEARLAGVEKLAVIGTICGYPKLAPIPFKEKDLWDGYPEQTNAPYGIAKKVLLVQSQAYRQEYGFQSIYLLPVNLYGPGDNFDPESSHVIPALIRKCLEAKERGDAYIEAWGDGSPTREFLYVKDAARAIAIATESYDKPDPINLGSAHEIGIKELTELIARLTGFQGRILWDTTKPNGQPRRKLDISRAQEEFGFEAKVSLVEGLTQTIDWYVGLGRLPGRSGAGWEPAGARR
jgi:GDP-L-fucose synthase